MIDTAAEGQFSISFSVVQPARVQVEIYDDRDLLVTELGEDTLREPGDYEIVWNARDANQVPVPAESYRYVLVWRVDGDSVPARYEPAEDLAVSRTRPLKVSRDDATGVLRYHLKRPSRVRIRSGLARGGPLLNTVLDWVPRAAGDHEEAWDGWDASRVLNFGSHEKLLLVADAFGLSRNSLLIGPKKSESTYLPELGTTPGTGRYPRPSAAKFRMFDFAHQPAGFRGDIRLNLQVGREKGEITGRARSVTPANPSESTPVTVSASPADARRLEDERFEVVFFVDGILVFETEVAFLPFTWKWDSTGAAPGDHFVTVNLRGFNGHFGFATKKVRITENEAASRS